MRSSHPSPRASGLTVGEVPRGVLEALRACPRRKIIANPRAGLVVGDVHDNVGYQSLGWSAIVYCFPAAMNRAELAAAASALSA
jgi:hypothetical protein